MPQGTVTGFLFKVVREQIPCTQEELAERLSVDKSTVQGWESGRRPLSATKAGNLVVLRRKLLLLGAPSTLVSLLATAMEADLLLGDIIRTGPGGDPDQHPLASWVLTRDTTHLIGWAVSGVVPALVAAHSGAPAARRGPVASAPLLDRNLRTAFFGSLRSTAEAVERAGDEAALLRRQLWYLSSYDRDWDAAEWFHGMRRRGTMTAVATGWSPRWAEVRSVAAAMARQGDPGLMRDFIDRSLTDHDDAEAANLNYWAHWLGLDCRPQTSDAFMAERQRPAWGSSSLFRAFAERLDRAVEYTDLYVHSLWALTLSRRGLFDADPQVSRELAYTVTALLDGGSLSSESRRELESVHYGLRVGGHCTGT
ncbi:helix-turn-helix domain-containing protein [Kitasatospora sp. NPDC094019]|uniref:helix-turn-helix domain-containing protein n=1 Tax=Kitasatospora sp. NPDC094019 TaxID=3364091 RepID=UPI00381D491B